MQQSRETVRIPKYFPFLVKYRVSCVFLQIYSATNCIIHFTCLHRPVPKTLIVDVPVICMVSTSADSPAIRLS